MGDIRVEILCQHDLAVRYTGVAVHREEFSIALYFSDSA
ncbi:hypothetical protein SNOG_14975 [Parastagonospora nodorum SN15]|uniref:Uncharacterized protein n=1 Tax=Phaeosphaeria nodorum (strain SN15 / ATCC MYA-4574 / FGSC 10173) TaxID=321614 RepID=Q0TZG5_PHANO|nr:hypothetical protein SNOG_14975 [Parastagonospora nodorum SN15]EAT77518.1 hypothetical protein SNOG_14975 [Parastagonospora nodorum SN15]